MGRVPVAPAVGASDRQKQVNGYVAPPAASGALDTVLTGLGQRRRVVAAVPSFRILFELLDSGDFLAFAPERLLRGRRSRVKIFETGLKIPPLEVTATWHFRVNDDARHKWLRETMIRVVGGK